MRSDPVTSADVGTTVRASAHWRAVDILSDLHLDASDPLTARAFTDYLAGCDADAVFILGDLFEVWVGDDVLSAAPADASRRFIHSVCAALRDGATRRPLYVMRGNRDFLLGSEFAGDTGATLLPDPALLDWGPHKFLLSHGDAWCLDDRDYLAFRTQVRSSAWQDSFLARPLAERETVARDLRARSEARKRDPQQTWADVDTATARQALKDHGAHVLVHGHTHRPAVHDLGDGLQRVVLSDWDAAAQPPRAEVLRLHADGQWQRRALL